MVGMTNRSARGLLDHITGKTTMFTVTTPSHLALFTAVGADDGTGFTEVSGGSYARVSMNAASWNAAAGTAPSTVDNAAQALFPAATADWGTVIAWGIYDAASAGNLLFWDYLGNHVWRPFSCSNASPGVLTAPAHGYSNGESVVVSAEAAGVLPATAGSWAGLLTVAGVTTDTFTVGVNTTGTGSGLIRRVVSQAVPSGVQPSFAAGALIMSGA